MTATTNGVFVFAKPPELVIRHGRVVNEPAYWRWEEMAQLASSRSPVNCILTNVFFAEGLRNAWHGVSSGGAYEESFAFDFKSTARFVASARVQGTSWRIKKRPACVFSASGLALLVTAEHPVDLHPGWRSNRSLVDLDLTSLMGLAESLRKRRGYRLFTTESVFPPADEKFAAFVPGSGSSVTGDWIEVARDDVTREADSHAWNECVSLPDNFQAAR